MSDFEEEDAFTCKVILVGASGVGKLSIISRFLNVNFSKTSTIGANFHTKKKISQLDMKYGTLLVKKNFEL